MSTFKELTGKVIIKNKLEGYVNAYVVTEFEEYNVCDTTGSYRLGIGFTVDDSIFERALGNLDIDKPEYKCYPSIRIEVDTELKRFKKIKNKLWIYYRGYLIEYEPSRMNIGLERNNSGNYDCTIVYNKSFMYNCSQEIEDMVSLIGIEDIDIELIKDIKRDAVSQYYMYIDRDNIQWKENSKYNNKSNKH